jgi:hypothetical protein
MPRECAQVARGHTLAAGRLWQAQDFAVRVWWRFGMALAVLASVTGVVISTLPSRAARDWGSIVPAVLICGAAASMGQMGMIRYRSARTRLYLVNADPRNADEPLPPGSPGLPGRYDFWLMLIAAVALFAIIFYAGTR